MSVGPGSRGPRRRLHPLSPLLHGAKTLAVIIAGISWQGYAQLGFLRWLILVIILCAGAVLWSLVSWYATGYRVVGRELRIDEGLLWRRTRAVPLERLQAVEVRRALLARLTGLAELRLEVVGGDKTEAPLAYLGRTEAVELREHLLSLIREGSALAAAEPAQPAAVPVFAVSNRDVVLSQLLTPQAWSVPVAVVFLLTQAAFAAQWTFVGIASTLTALAGVMFQPVRRVFTDWNFQLGVSGDGLHVRHGLVDLRQQLLPPERVQAVRAVWPLLWRHRGWLRLELEVAGYRAEDAETPVSRLLPVGDYATARRILPTALPGVDLAGLALARAPQRAAVLEPLGLVGLGIGLTDRVVAVSQGRLTRRLTVVDYRRVQSVRVTRGPVQRLLGLASLHVDTAAAAVVAAHRDTAEAYWLARQISDRVLAALPAAPPPLGRPDDHEGQTHVGPSDDDVDHVVLARVDQGEGHRQWVGEQQRPPPAAHPGQEEDHDEQREGGVQ